MPPHRGSITLGCSLRESAHRRTRAFTDSRAVKKMFDGIGPEIVLECVGTKESLQQALKTVRAGGQVGFVGVPYGS